jgi:hypothetical protein
MPTRRNFLQVTERAHAKTTDTDFKRARRLYGKPSLNLRGELTIVFQNAANSVIART